MSSSMEVTENDDTSPAKCSEFQDSENTPPNADEPLQPLHQKCNIVSSIMQYTSLFHCSFYLKPEMLQYYHSPGPMGFCRGRPVLLGSPEFDGGLGTRWHLCITFDKWIGNQRWISLYLRRASFEKGNNIKLQCRFSVIDANGKTLFSPQDTNMYDDHSLMKPGETCGFDQFLPFKALQSMLMNGNCLMIQTRLLFLSQTSDLESIFQAEDSDESDTSTVVDEKESYPWSDFWIPELETKTDLEDAIGLYIDDVLCGYVDKKTLAAKSESFKECLQHPEFLVENVLNIMEKRTNNILEDKIIVQQFINFIQTNHCKMLETGSYRELSLLLNLAKKMRTIELIENCVSAMTLLVTQQHGLHSVAACHLQLLQEMPHGNRMDEGLADAFSYTFEKNFKKIRKTKDFKRIVKKHHKHISQLVFEPS